MSVGPGARVGPYEVTALLGAGGMGEVFRARDPRLNRDVALKVLLPQAIGSADRRTRFEREAQVLASISHPNIAQVFGVEDAEGTPAIVMELVDGPSLAEGLARGALPIDEALSIATQLCVGLEAAHERGVVHRDLKPANIKVRPDGLVKILDFGLARALTDDSAPDLANSPTVLGARTEVGIVLGTAAYMSPEQARAQVVDRRADIWAFGCVLYEMLTGKRAFAGESTTDILVNVVQNEPDWSRLPAGLSSRVRELLQRCLKKNPKDRLRDITDARYQIEEALRTAVTDQLPRAMDPRATPPGRTSRYVIAAGCVVAGALATFAALRLTERMPGAGVDSSAPTRAVVTLPPNTTLALGRGSAVVLSPDGRRLVFSGRSAGKVQLYLRELERFESTLIAGTDDASNPFFSPDGRWVGFFAEGKLKKVSLDGGAPVTLAEARVARGEAWAPDDTILFTPSNNAGLWRVSALGGKAEPLTTLVAGELSHRWPRVLPDGQTMIFSLWNDTGWEPARIAAQRVGNDTRKVIVPAGGGYPRYIRDTVAGRGYLVYARAEGLLAAPFDESQLALTGQPVPLTESVITNLSGGAHFDLSTSGALAYVPGTTSEVDRDLVWMTLDGKATPARRVSAMGRFWMLAPDGNRVVRINTTGPNRDIWIDDLTRGTSERVTTAKDSYTPIWSSDGQWIAFADGIPNRAIYRMPVRGAAKSD